MSTKLPPVQQTPRGQNNSEQDKSCDDDKHSTGSGSRSAPHPPPSERKSKTAIDLLDDEIEFLKEQLEEQTKVRKNVEKRLEKARLKEAMHNADKRKTRVADHRRNEAARVIQSALRGYFIRRYMASTIDASTVQLKAAINADPEILPEQLQSLQHSLHDLVFQAQDQDQAAITIQCWWRMVLAQRLFRLNWIAQKVKALHLHFHLAATSIQSWWRGHLERRKYLEFVREATEASKRRMIAESERHLLCVLRVQRCIRGRLARKEAERRKGKFANLHGEDVPAAQLSKTAPPYGTPWPKPPVQPSAKKRAEFENLTNNGLIPFYWTATEVVRHKIGGHSWLGSNHMVRKVAQEDVDDLGEELYDVYPEGISEDFRGLLKVDGEKKKTKRKRRKLKLPPVGSNAQNILRTEGTVVINYQECWKSRPVPSNSERRAQARSARKPKDEENDEEGGHDVESMAPGDAHPLLFFNQPLPSFALD